MVQSSSSRWDSYGDALKLGDAELLALLDVRRAVYQSRANAQPRANVQELRAHRRLSVQGALWVPAEIREASGNVFRLRVYPIDLSSSGMCFFGERFLHPGTGSVITLRLVDGEMLQVAGKVVRCEYIQGQAHEIGVEFDEHVDMALFFANVPGAIISPAIATNSPPAAVGTEKSAAAESTGNAKLNSSNTPANSRPQADQAQTAGDAQASRLAVELEKRLQAMAQELNSMAKCLTQLHQGNGQPGKVERIPLGTKSP